MIGQTLVSCDWQLGSCSQLVKILPGEPGQFHLWPGVGQGS